MESRRLALTFKRVGVVSLAKFGCVWGMVLYAVPVAVLLALAFPAIALNILHGENPLLELAAAGLLVGASAIFGGIGGFIHWLLFAMMANTTARLSGGIHVEFDRTVWVRHEVSGEQSQPKQEDPVKHQIQERLNRAATLKEG